MWKLLKLDGLILSGGNTLADYADMNDKTEGVSIERDNYEKALLKVALSTNTPVLGVCRGLQVINVFYQGQLKKIKGHAGTKHPLVQEILIEALKFHQKLIVFITLLFHENT